MDQIATQISNIATTAATHSWAVVSNFLILIGLAVAILVVSYRSRGGLLSLLLSFYVGYAIFLVFPYTKEILGAGGTPLTKAVISIIIFILASIPSFLFLERLTHGGFGILSVVPRVGLSVLGAAFLMALAYHVFHVNNIYTFPEPMNTIFAPDQYFFWWFLAPMVGLLVLVH